MKGTKVQTLGVITDTQSMYGVTIYELVNVLRVCILCLVRDSDLLHFEFMELCCKKLRDKLTSSVPKSKYLWHWYVGMCAAFKRKRLFLTMLVSR